MLVWRYINGFEFSVCDQNDNEVSLEEWYHNPKKINAPVAILKEFHENGLADFVENRIIVPVEELLKLDDLDKELLGLPEQYPFDIYIEADGVLKSKEFNFKYNFFDFAPNGHCFQSSMSGPIVKFEKNEYLLNINQYRLLKALDEFNALPNSERNLNQNLLRFSDIKELNIDAALILDQYLQNEHVLKPDKIKLDLSYDNETFEVKPKVDGVDNESFQKKVDIFTKAKSIYNLSDHEGKRTRIILDDKQVNEIENIKKNLRKITDKDKIKDIIESPIKYFDPDEIDLSEFYSDRVIEIGLYKPKFYPFISPYKSQWIPGIKIEDKIKGDTKIAFKTLEDLGEFEEELKKTKKDGFDAFEWKGVNIPVNTASELVKRSKEQFKKPLKPIENETVINRGDEQVLIIKENVEELNFVGKGKSKDDLKNLTFEPIKNLDQSITLKEHQKEGISWLQTLYIGFGYGALLADDMGLGKTLQILYMIEWHYSRYPENQKPYLIVAPVSILENWENEYARFFNPSNLELVRVSGSILTKSINQDVIDYFNKPSILLTNYETIRTYQLNLCAIDYAIVVLDEAQKVKTPGTLVTNAAKALKADFKIAMTGTPVENTLVDLWCLMDFAKPGLLGNAKEFSKEFQNPLKDKDTDLKILGAELRSRIGNYILRRLKSDVAKDLPNKIDDDSSKLMREMPEEQHNRYVEEINKASEIDEDSASSGNQILQSIHAMRSISDHPYLIERNLEKYEVSELIGSSAKLIATVEVLEKIKQKEEKVIVFADRKDTQKMLQRVVYQYFETFPSIINGDTPTSAKRSSNAKLSRQQAIDRFQNISGFNVIIMSQLAAGVGLNVTSANHVIHYSRHWNPAKESQATDRAYRIGQKKDVYVYYPMAVCEQFESFDVILDKLLEKKKSLASSTLFPTERAEVKVSEIFSSIKGEKQEVFDKPVKFNDIERLKPLLFEAYTAALFSKMGYKTLLTPCSNDKGADVLAFSESKENLIIQTKQSSNHLSPQAVQEIVAAIPYYENVYGHPFVPVVFTNSILGSGAKELAHNNNVKCFEKNFLENNIEKFTVTMQEIRFHETERLKN